MKKDAQQANTQIKDPDEWTTGDEPMTGAQESYIHTLAREAGEPDAVQEDLTKAEASKQIDELRQKTGRTSRGRPRRTAAKGRSPARN